jgi:hypothetical protein
MNGFGVRYLRCRSSKKRSGSKLSAAGVCTYMVASGKKSIAVTKHFVKDGCQSDDNHDQLCLCTNRLDPKDPCAGASRIRYRVFYMWS